MAAGVSSFVGSVSILPFNFAPTGWALCSGQLLAISSNTALFSLLGTNYGGNGTSTFGLPNITGAVLVGSGTSTADGNNYIVGQTGGVASITLDVNNLPSHTHAPTNPLSVPTGSGAASTNSPVNNYPAQGSANLYSGLALGPTNIPMNTSALTVGSTGSNLAYNNLQSFLGLYYVIALTGIFPARS
jgi:microcystin-dependent protein